MLQVNEWTGPMHLSPLWVLCYLVEMGVGRMLWGSLQAIMVTPGLSVCRVPCPCAASCPPFHHLAMSVSLLWALTEKKEPDFFTSSVLPVCWILAPFSQMILCRASRWIYKGVIRSWEEDPRSNDIFPLWCASLVKQEWQVREGKPTFRLQKGYLAFW